LLPTSQERIAEINRTIELYRHHLLPVQNYAAVGQADIHAYAGRTVSTGATEKKQTLNDAVVSKLKMALNSQGFVPYSHVLEAILQHAHKTYNQTIKTIGADSAAKALQDRDWQLEALGVAKDDRNAQAALSLVYTLLHQQPERLELWLNTYLRSVQVF
jgi:hypothetical protein